MALDGQSVVVGAQARAAGKGQPDDVAPRAKRSPEPRNLGPEQRDDVDVSERGKVCGAAVVGNQYVGHGVEHEQLSHRGSASHGKAPGMGDLSNERLDVAGLRRGTGEDHMQVVEVRQEPPGEIDVAFRGPAPQWHQVSVAGVGVE